MKKRVIRSLGTCFLLAMFLLLEACQSQQTTGTGLIPSGSTTPPSTNVNVPRTDCPAANQARAMNMLTIPEKTDPTIVYQYTQVSSNQTSLKSYNVKNKKKNNIYAVPAGEGVSDPTLSADGKWILFISYSSYGGVAQGNEKLQAIGTDGQGLQTLYCTDSLHVLTHVQWSPDLAHIAFSIVSYTNSTIQSDGILYLLNTTNAFLQTLPLRLGMAYNAFAWLDATHVYIAKTKDGSAPSNMSAAQEIYLFDINGGVQPVFTNPHNVYWNATLSPDGQRLSMSEMAIESGSPATIVVQPATGGQATSIYSTKTQGRTEVCAATDNTLLVSISHATTNSNPASDNGLYRMNASGTEAVKLFPLQGDNDSVEAGCMYSWQTVSRDNSMHAFYAFADTDAQSRKLYFGPLYSGGQPTLFADTGNTLDRINIVGWTTL